MKYSTYRKRLASTYVDGELLSPEGLAERAIEVTCSMNNVTIDELKSPLRRQSYSVARAHFWCYMVQRVPLTYTELGAIFGKTHATVIHHINNHKAYMEPIRMNSSVRYNEDYALKYEAIEQILDEEFNYKKSEQAAFRYRITALVDDPQNWTRIMVEYHEPI
jgi:hypothetical protein